MFRYSHAGSTHTLNNYCDTSDNWTDHDMDIYMARNPTTRNGLVPLWDQLYSWYFLNFTSDGDKLPYFRAILWHQQEQQHQQLLLFKPVPSPIYTIYNNYPSSTPSFNHHHLPSNEIIYPLTPPPEYSPPLPSIIDTEERSDNDEEEVTTTTVINCNRNDFQSSSNRTTTLADTARTTETDEEGVVTAVHQNQLNHVRLIYDDFCDNNINTTRSNYFRYMNEYNAINLDNYRNYVREINNTTSIGASSSDRTINNVVESNNT